MKRIEHPVFFLLRVLLMTSCIPAEMSPFMRPHCLDNCSDEVKCKVEFGRCPHDFTNSKLVASHPTNLKVIQSVDGEFKYIDLEWTPPDDGSFRDLKAFNVLAGFTNHGDMPGDRGTQCYKVKIVDPDWIERYSNTTVNFYLRCIRLGVKDYMTMRLSIYSLPLNEERTKQIAKEIEIKPDLWNPDIERWADAKNYIHIRIRNPYPGAMFYKVKLRHLTQGKVVVAFCDDFPAQHVEMKDQSKRMTVLDDNHYPHFVIKNIPTHSNYSIELLALFLDRSLIPNTRVHTRPFAFNFTDTSKRLPATSPNVSRVAPESRSDAGVSVQDLTIAVVVIILVFSFAGLIVWKVKCQAITSHHWLTCKFLVPSLFNNAKDLPKIIPVYCEENEHFVRAVESHVNLLHRYVNVLPVPQFVGSRSESHWCPLLRRGSPLLTVSELKVTDVIIYLSPGLGRLVQMENLQGLSRLDEFCHRTLQSLQIQRQSSQREEFTIHVVTFDCFQNGELDCLPVLSNMLVLDDNAPATRQRAIESTPIKLAAFNQNSWRLENLDQLLCHLCRVRDFPRELPAGVVGWHESPEAKAVEQFLDRFGTPPVAASDSLPARSLCVRYSPNSATLVCQTETTSMRPSPQGHNRGKKETCKQMDPGDLYDVDMDTALSSRSSHAQESGCVCADDSGSFYSSDKAYTKVPNGTLPEDAEQLIVDMSGYNGDAVRYTHNPEKMNLLLNHERYKQNQRIKPPPPYQNGGGSNTSVAESESDNEHFSSSLESDSLLTTEPNKSHGRKENKDRNSLRNNSSTAISPPSNLVYTHKDSISDLIAAHNTTRGWNGGPSFA